MRDVEPIIVAAACLVLLFIRYTTCGSPSSYFIRVKIYAINGGILKNLSKNFYSDRRFKYTALGKTLVGMQAKPVALNSK